MIKENPKKLILCHTFKFFNHYIFATWYGEDIWYFKLRLFDLTGFTVWDIKGLLHYVAKI